MDEQQTTGQGPVEPVPGAPAGGDASAVAVASRWPAQRGLAFGVVGAAVVAGMVVGGVIGARTSTDAAADSATTGSTQAQGAAFSPYGQWTPPSSNGWDTLPTLPGYGSDGSSGSDGSGSTSTQTPAVAATAAQQTGVVTITSTLGYEGGESAGTGMILSSDGLVLTNNHVIEGATAITVTDESTGRQYEATVVGTSATSDVALLQLTGASGLSTVTLDDDGGVSSGDAVTAVGNAEGTGNLVAADGTVTATDQTMSTSSSGYEQGETLSGLIEFSAAVVAGDSGGPVVDAEGEVVGITTAASVGGTSTVAYAIDIADAMAVVHQIESGTGTDTVQIGLPAFLGVAFATSSSAGTGATIAGVLDGTPAASAGLVAGDTITAVGGVAVASADDLSAALDAHAPGDSVTLTWATAAGAAGSATVTLIAGPAA
jgi:S1-C subfamily serine protease